MQALLVLLVVDSLYVHCLQAYVPQSQSMQSRFTWLRYLYGVPTVLASSSW
jgi:hypothetical protein